MPFLICPSCGYVIADTSQPCPSCGAEAPLPEPAALPEPLAPSEPGCQMRDEYNDEYNYDRYDNDDYGAREETPKKKKIGTAKLFFVIVFLVLCVLYFFRPRAAVSEIVGKWKDDHGDMFMRYEFRPDNTVMLDMMMPNTLARLYWKEGTYETNGNELTITFEDSPSETGKFRFSGDTLTLIMDDGAVRFLERAP